MVCEGEQTTIEQTIGQIMISVVTVTVIVTVKTTFLIFVGTTTPSSFIGPPMITALK